jgi:hypothetical protein
VLDYFLTRICSEVEAKVFTRMRAIDPPGTRGEMLALASISLGPAGAVLNSPARCVETWLHAAHDLGPSDASSSGVLVDFRSDQRNTT